MAEEDQPEPIRPGFPTGRVKKIMKLDKDINKINSEALLLVSRSTELFLEFLAERSAEVATERKRKIVKLEHLRVAVKRHQPTSDFLLDSLPLPENPPEKPRTEKPDAVEKPALPGTRRIDQFFKKSLNEAPVHVEEP